MQDKNFYIMYASYDTHNYTLNYLHREYEWFPDKQAAMLWWYGYKNEYPNAVILEANEDELYKALKQYCDRTPARTIKPHEMLSTDAQIVHAKYEL